MSSGHLCEPTALPPPPRPSLSGRPNRNEVCCLAGVFAALQQAQNSGEDLSDVVSWVLDSNLLNVRGRSAEGAEPILLTFEILEEMTSDRRHEFGSSANIRPSSELRDLAADAILPCLVFAVDAIASISHVRRATAFFHPVGDALSGLDGLVTGNGWRSRLSLPRDRHAARPASRAPSMLLFKQITTL